ncbi:MAG: hypothetical protein AB8B79_14755 [Granulosicoccus sp.]
MTRHASKVLLVAAIVLAVLLAMLPGADNVGQSHVDQAFKRALIGFALARSLNGVISVAQGTEVAIQPAGVGVNFTPGQILDPVNDLVERFSWIMMLASSSLGIQKVLLSMSAWNGLLIALFISGVFFISCIFLARFAGLRKIAQRLFLFILVLRFMMPAISIANDWVYRTFLEADYVQASASLDKARLAIGDINAEVMAEQQKEPGTILERARSIYNQALARVDIEKRLDEYRQAAESVSENTIQLVVVFLMQTLVFPLFFLFAMLSLIRRLTRSERG